MRFRNPRHEPPLATIACLCTLLGLREDEHAARLLEITQKDADLRRMTRPVPVEEFDKSGILLQPRFAVTQSRPDGSSKTRAVDHFSW